MGYDMHVVDETGTPIREEGSTLHPNLSGGLHLAQSLVEHGMGYWSTEERLPYPKLEAYAWINDEQVVIDPEAEQELFAYLRQSGLAEPEAGIAVYKICGSNDGWWVTKEECETALVLWEEAGQPEVSQFTRLIPFLRIAAAHEGFRVW